MFSKTMEKDRRGRGNQTGKTQRSDIQLYERIGQPQHGEPQEHQTPSKYQSTIIGRRVQVVPTIKTETQGSQDSKFNFLQPGGKEELSLLISRTETCRPLAQN